MDLLSNRTMEISSLALDGLAERHKVLSANIANAQTPNYVRSDVQFEDQLRNILSMEDLKEATKVANSNTQANGSLQVNHSSIAGSLYHDDLLSRDNYSNFKPNLVADSEAPEISNGNNVNIETEMVELSKNGTKYTILSELEGRQFKKIETIIKESSV